MVTSPKVLIVDDEPLIRWSIAESMKGEGWQVLEAGNGREAIARFAELPDLLVTDLRLPDTSGVSLLRLFRQDRGQLPAILMTAYRTPEATREALDAGALFVFDKPFQMAELLQLVSRLLGEIAQT